jgi:hypothetical protein
MALKIGATTERSHAKMLRTRSDVRGPQYVGTLPANATPTGGTFVTATGRATFGYTAPEPAGACMPNATASFDLTFTNAGFTGSLTLADCAGGGDAGPSTKCTGTYSLTGERR